MHQKKKYPWFLYKNNPNNTPPYVTYGLIAANVPAYYESNLPPQQLIGFFHLGRQKSREN